MLHSISKFFPWRRNLNGVGHFFHSCNPFVLLLLTGDSVFACKRVLVDRHSRTHVRSFRNTHTGFVTGTTVFAFEICAEEENT